MANQVAVRKRARRIVRLAKAVDAVAYDIVQYEFVLEEWAEIIERASNLHFDAEEWKYKTFAGESVEVIPDLTERARREDAECFPHVEKFWKLFWQRRAEAARRARSLARDLGPGFLAPNERQASLADLLQRIRLEFPQLTCLRAAQQGGIGRVRSECEALKHYLKATGLLN